MEDFELDFGNSQNEKCFDWIEYIEIRGQFEVRGDNVNVYPNQIVIHYDYEDFDKAVGFNSYFCGRYPSRRLLSLGHDTKAEFDALCDLMDSIYDFHNYMAEKHADDTDGDDIAGDESWALRQDHFSRH